MLLLSVNWGHIWMVTLLGFSLVVVLLVVLIFILKLFGWIMQQINKPTSKPAVAKPASTQVTTTKENDDMTINGNITAAIAMALNMYYFGIHDEEPTQITVTRHNTQWNNKMYGMNNLHR